MTKNLENADAFVKVVLAISVIFLYSAKIIAGPFAMALMVLAALVLLAYASKIIFGHFYR